MQAYYTSLGFIQSCNSAELGPGRKESETHLSGLKAWYIFYQLTRDKLSLRV